MAEGFEPYHVPQQSRRDKLRFGAVAEPATPSLHGLLPHYDPSLLQSDLLSCAAAAAASRGFHDHHLQPLATAEDGGGCKSYSVNSLFKEEEGYRRLILPSSSSSLSTNHHHHQQQLYGLDPRPQAAINPSCSASIHDMRSSRPFSSAPPTLQCLRDFTHSSYNTLSLSLSSHDDNADNNLPDDNLSLPVELNLQRYGAKAAGGGYQIPAAISVGGGMASIEVSRSSVPLGPFTGYSSILKGSRFLRPAQQVLEELCNVGRANPVEKITGVDSSLLVDASVMQSYLSVVDSGSSLGSSGGDGGEVRKKKSWLISMLEEVCRQYRQYYQQMHDAVASFEYIAGFGNAAPHANLALETMSKHFRCLKSAITDQLQLNMDKGNPRRDDGCSRLGSKGYFDRQQPVWRPQRGLPERAVTVLRAWLFDHFLHPYPTDTDKIMLAKQTGLSRNQVSNWFINARVRLWKPMVEEVYVLETQQGQKASKSHREDRRVNINSLKLVDCQLPSASEAPSTSAQRVRDTQSGKQTWSNLPEFPMRSDDGRPKNLSYDLSGHCPHVSTGEGIGGLNSSVSLTLGLHQNNRRMSLPEAFEVNVVQRFGLDLEGSGEGFVLSGYEGQGRHFRRDVFGGQLLHDFVG